MIYGSNDTALRRVRTFVDGKLKISRDGLLEYDQNGLLISGDVRNTWVGMIVLQSLFVSEHNAICDLLKVNTQQVLIIYYGFLVGYQPVP